MPNSSQFHRFINGRMGEDAKKSCAYKAVQFLFEMSNSMYSNLDTYTGEQLTIFVERGDYLSTNQERDLVAMIALSIRSFPRNYIDSIIDSDWTCSETEKAVLKSAVQLFFDTAQANCTTLGNPQWLKD